MSYSQPLLRTARRAACRGLIASAVLLPNAAVWAQPSPPRPGSAPVAPAADAAPAIALQGTIARWLTNPNGDVDGMLLTDGTQVNFPPHLSARVTDALQVKEAVQLVGWREGAVFRATSLRGTSSGRTVRDDGAPADPPAPRDPAALQEMTASGRVEALLRGPRGDVNGVILQSGEQVRFPPHVGMRYGSLLQRGATLSAKGYGTRNAFGTAFEATALGESLASLSQVFTAPRQLAPGMPPVPAAAPPVRPAS